MSKKTKTAILVILLVAMLLTIYLQFKFFGSAPWWIFLVVFGVAYYVSNWLKKH